MKEKIYKEKGEDFRVENQKLILLGSCVFFNDDKKEIIYLFKITKKGKVLEDKQTVSEYNINESSSLVCFAAKVRN